VRSDTPFVENQSTASSDCRYRSESGVDRRSALKPEAAVTTQMRVLIADDERPSRMFLMDLLQTFASVTVIGAAASGDEALDLIERGRPHLVLLDVEMPGLDGFGVVHMLDSSNTPLVAFVTAFDEYGDLASALQ
jgi:CheY-like chemotaxis protein